MGEVLASRDFTAHLWVGMESGTLAQYCVATLSSGSGVLWASSPISDLKDPLSTLPWCEQVDWKEQQAVASATAPAAITSELLMASQGVTQPPAETADLQPTLRDLDVVQAVRSVSQARSITWWRCSS